MSEPRTDLPLEAPVAAPVAAPAADAAPLPIAAPAAEVVAPAPVVADAPVVAPEAVPSADGAAPVVEAAAAQKTEEPAAPEGKPSLLAEAGAPKPDETKPADGATAADAVTEAPALTYETLKLPDGFTAAPEQLKGFTGLLTENGVTPEVGQKLLDLYGTEMSAFVEATRADQFKVFNATKEGWRTSVMADPQIGGAGHRTAMQAVARMRDAFVSSAPVGSDEYKQHMREFAEFDALTGGGDHPALLRMLHNIARRYDEPVVPSVTGSPTKTNGQPPGQRGPKALYDNPTRAN